MKKTMTFAFAILAMAAFSVPFENIKFSHNVDTQSLEVARQSIGETNGVTTIGKIVPGTQGIPPQRISTLNGIVFDIYEEGTVKFFFNELDEDANPTDRIFINDKPLTEVIQARVDDGIQQSQGQASSNVVQTIVYNPLWGKHLAAIGDSLTISPSMEVSYPYLIA